MTAEEMKAAESGAQPAPLRIEGVDISPKRDEGVLKVRAWGAGTRGRRAPRPPSQPPSRRAWQRPAGPRGRGGGHGRRCSLSRRPCSRQLVATPSRTGLRSRGAAGSGGGGLGARASPGPSSRPPWKL